MNRDLRMVEVLGQLYVVVVVVLKAITLQRSGMN